jgi:cobalt-precorrin 5A hydrolase / precorrin-3B C17-methyltransferase
MSDLPSGAAIIVLGASAVGLARRLQATLPGSSLHAPANKGITADRLFDSSIDHIAELFQAGMPIVGLCASGILIRAVAKLLDDKRSEPPVIAVAEDGSSAVPLLGGHRGANRLARAIAAATGGVAAITTAGDVVLGFGLDEPPAGWHVANPERVKPIAAALLAGGPVALSIEAGTADWLNSGRARFDAAAPLRIRITDCAFSSDDCDLVLHPPVLALGVGCERGCTADELNALADATLAEHGLAAGSVAVVVSLDLKTDEPAVHALAARLGIPARFFSAEELRAETARLASPSETVFRETGCYGVAEGAALAAVGPNGALVAAKCKSRRATCAVARAATSLSAEAIGRPQGSLAIVGIGPGDPAWRIPAASAALDSAPDIVGYTLYLDLLGTAIAGKARHATALGSETERARRALDLAASGRAVALVSSGDAGIYGLASLVFELIDREDRPAWRRVALSVVPGVSALQAAAARAGAPLGHDFCAINLSDNLKPWAVIEKRLRLAAEADFAIAMYNPRSASRPEGFGRALAVLKEAGCGERLVIFARAISAADERIETVTLNEATPEMADMRTLVIVGNSQTRRVGRWVYAPRQAR